MKLVISALLLLSISACTNGSMKGVKNPAPNLPRFSDFVRKTDRSAATCKATRDDDVCLMTWLEALKYCQDNHGHLPTAREYAKLLKSQGVKVVEWDAIHPARIPDGWYPVYSRNPDGNVDGFYMNHQGYKGAPAGTSLAPLWTSSIPPQNPNYAHVFYPEWGGGGGDPAHHKHDYKNAVKCIWDK